MKINKLLTVFVFWLTMMSCSEKISSDSVFESIQGSFYRTIVSSIGEQRMSYTFNSDMTGVWYSSGRTEQWAYFAYYIEGKEINCIGSYGNSLGKVSEWSSVMVYDGGVIYSKNDKNDIYARDGVVEDVTPDLKPTAGKTVDLGLSVKWAGWNVGASSPEDYGEYYAWGECAGKYKYDLNTYIYYNKSIGTNISATEYDVARNEWGSGWRMPTVDEIRELIDKCSWREFTYNGVRGNTVTGPNGNKIFIPLAGYKQGSSKGAVGEKTYLWSSTANYSEKNRAYCLYANPSDAYCEIKARSWGINVRPVCD